MVFRKSCFFKALFACICLIGWTNLSVAENSVVVNCVAEPGFWCRDGQTYPCPAGCYCLGGENTEHNVEQECHNHEELDPDLELSGVRLCPEDFPESNEGAASEEECFATTGCPGAEIENSGPYNCAAGYYLPAQSDRCTRCEAGHRCPGGSFYFSCDYDQGIVPCVGNEYSSGGASVCQICDGIGHAVIQNDNGFNTRCDSCPVGTFAKSDHTGCGICHIGYKCTGSAVARCVGNQYSDTTGSVVCSVCSGPGKGVIHGIGENNEEINIGCDTCPSGKYANQGVCEPCPAGHHCVNGYDLGLCDSGTCAAFNNVCVDGGANTCKPCSDGEYSNDNRTACSSCATNAMPPFNADFYEQVSIDGQVGESVCGIKLGGATACQSESNVIWYVVDGEWRLLEDNAIADRDSYVKSQRPNSPNGSDADWCAACPDGTYNVSGGVGANSCTVCKAGYCDHDGNCLPCQPGYYCPGTGGLANACSSVSDNYGIEDESYKCPKGAFSAAGQASCRSCGEGYTTSGEGTAYSGNSLSDICSKRPLKLKKLDSTDSFSLPLSLKEKSRLNRSVIRNK